QAREREHPASTPAARSSGRTCRSAAEPPYNEPRHFAGPRVGPSLTERSAMERRLAAIFTADVAGYSRLRRGRVEGRIDRLSLHRRELIEPKIAEHQGRLVKTTGDGVLAEF